MTYGDKAKDDGLQIQVKGRSTTTDVEGLTSKRRSNGGLKNISRTELGNMGLLVGLYAMQGVPLGLTLGTMPFLLQSELTYTQLGLFAISAYPYSFKLFWSPIVDSVYNNSVGRRKSWIVPIQLFTAILLYLSGDWIQTNFKAGNVWNLTTLFFVLVLLAATQDIAVDGWALTLLSKENVGYASTCQTIGMNLGYFTSFTVFLAFLNNADFCNAHIRSNVYLRKLMGPAFASPRDEGLVSLGGYIQFWGCVFALSTLAIALFKKESYFNPQDDDDLNKPLPKGAKGQDTWQQITGAYRQLWNVVQLPAIWKLSLFLVTFRLAMLPAESTAALKLLDKGVNKDVLASMVLIQLPIDLVSALIAGRWAVTKSPYPPFIAGFFIRLAMAGLLTYTVHIFPMHANTFSSHPLHFMALGAIGLVTSFTSTLMFTAVGSFFTKISDPAMGGTYLTLLNTIANIGVILPKAPLLWLMDLFTRPECHGVDGELHHVIHVTCPKKLVGLDSSNPCIRAGGECAIVKDGFFAVSYMMVVVGVVLGMFYLRWLPALVSLPIESWRAQHKKKVW